MDLEEWMDFLGGFDESEELKRFDLFRNSLLRTAGLVVIEDSLPQLTGFEDNPIYQEYLSILDRFFEEKEREFNESPDDNSNDREGFFKIFKVFFNIGMSLGALSEKSLYYEAVVSSVIGFETFLKSSIVYLVAEFREIEERFTPELDKGLSYNKIKEFDYERDKVLGYVVADTISFFDLDAVNKAFRNAFGTGTEKGWSIFSSKDAKQELQRFIRIRHLVVHRGGVVDSRFKKDTNCSEEIGEEYKIEGEYIEKMMKEMFHVASKIDEQIKIIEQEANP